MIRRGRFKSGLLTHSKNLKTPFLKDIGNSFHEVTYIGLEPHQFFFFKISQQIRLLETSKVLAEMGYAMAGRLFEIWQQSFCQMRRKT